ncbi:MAG TPA: response regulator [Methylomirabilota bacterium]|nr:response regulator [Methylomirabilota bacterium]
MEGRAVKAATIETDVAPRTSPRGTETVLIVEDEGEVRAVARDILEAVGYTVLEARTPEEALLIAVHHAGPIPLVLTDVVMPRISGCALFRRLSVLRPGMRVLYMSGHAHEAIVRHGVVDFGRAFVPKPFTLDGLARKVREVLDDARAGEPG